MKVMLIPGNGNSDVNDNWFPYAIKELKKLGLDVIAENMPDPYIARMSIWLPFIEEKIGKSEDVILIGHSSGAVAIQRLLEKRKVKIAILVGTCYTDLNDEHEKLSGYYDEEWNWGKIKENCENIIVFASQDDPYISIEESRFIHEKLNCEYHEFTNQGHMGDKEIKKTEFPEIIVRIKELLKNARS
jgi:uncharacterized protein